MVLSQEPTQTTFHVAGITVAHPHTQIVCWSGASTDFLPGLTLTLILPITTLGVTVITPLLAQNHIFKES
jgi:hypothetical protein